MLPCTAVGTPLALYLLALVVRLVLLAGFPDPAYPDSFYYVDVAHSLAAGPRLHDRRHLDLPRGRRRDPGEPGPAGPLERPLDAPRLDRPGAVHLAAGTHGDRLRAAVRPRGRARRPAHVGASRATPGRRDSSRRRRHPGRDPGWPPRSSWPSPTTSASTSRSWPGALWMGARGLRGDARAFALGGLLVGLATLARNDGVLVGAALGARLRLGPLGGLAQRRLAPAPGDPGVGRAWPASRSSSPCWRPWLARQLAVFGSISPSSASGKVLFIRSIDEWNSITTPANLAVAALPGPRAARSPAGSAAWWPPSSSSRSSWAASSWCRSCSSAAGPAGASLDFGPFFAYAGAPVRLLGARLRGPRARRHLHPFGRRARAPRLHPGPRGDRGRRRLGRGPALVLGCRRGDPLLHGRGGRLRGGHRGRQRPRDPGRLGGPSRRLRARGGRPGRRAARHPTTG